MLSFPAPSLSLVLFYISHANPLLIIVLENASPLVTKTTSSARISDTGRVFIFMPADCTTEKGQFWSEQSGFRCKRWQLRRNSRVTWLIRCKLKGEIKKSNQEIRGTIA